MRIISANLNGIRAAARKGFFDWMLAQDADVVCIQETRAQEHQLDDDVFSPVGYYRYLFDAEKKGYSGVALYCRKEPNKVSVGLGFDLSDKEGRYIQADYDEISIASLYLPSGSSGDDRQNLKYHFLEKFEKNLQSFRRKKREFVICGDMNIVHKEIDIKNWKSNQKTSGCLPEERAWLDKVFDEIGFVDAFRVVNQDAEQYTWWSNRGQARDKNVGWRIDYHFITPGLRDTVQSTSVFKDQWYSDHAPLTIDYDYQF